MTSEESHPTRVFVYGSCVARDTLDIAPPERFTVVRYVARQSLVSTFARPATLPEVSGLDSPFQRRMLEGDARGNLVELLEQDTPRIDLLVWDLTDERLGLLTSPDGRVVTRSVETISAGLVEKLGDWRLVEFGTDEHFTLWGDAARAFVEVLDRLALRDRTVLLALPWAEQSDSGAPVPASFGTSSVVANARYARYFDLASTLGIRVTHVPRDQAVAAEMHRWGPAPFHYTRTTYDRALAAIAAHAGASAARPDGVPQP